MGERKDQYCRNAICRDLTRVSKVRGTLFLAGRRGAMGSWAGRRGCSVLRSRCLNVGHESFAEQVLKINMRWRGCKSGGGGAELPSCKTPPPPPPAGDDPSGGSAEGDLRDVNRVNIASLPIRIRSALSPQTAAGATRWSSGSGRALRELSVLAFAARFLCYSVEAERRSAWCCASTRADSFVRARLVCHAGLSLRTPTFPGRTRVASPCAVLPLETRTRLPAGQESVGARPPVPVVYTNARTWSRRATGLCEARDRGLRARGNIMQALQKVRACVECMHASKRRVHARHLPNCV